ncbi:hypothetical protein [Paracandidimonas soli]|uniref:Uncharacterized protein n=1 Tax=Paracandidimonas soli TaxID=1917182 RepID=A0A4V2VS13_9BURK|nr:hypothetical protein [Paracandidimonas soli]TCV00540.1 hypothetical protein EV686_103120 [Paracandidimonas soli]
MNKKELAQRMLDADLTMVAAIWLGGIDVDSPPDLLVDWADDGKLEGVGMLGGDLLDFLARNEYRMPFIAEFSFPVPRNFHFHKDGSAHFWSTGGVYKHKVFLADTIENCITQACTWAETEFIRYESEALAAAKERA